MKKVGGALVLVMLLSACSLLNTPKATEKYEPSAYKNNVRDHLAGHGPIHYGITKTNPKFNYSQDTNMNPHDYRSLNQQRFNISDDQDKIRQIVKDETGINPQMVTINGHYAHVHINVPSNMSKKEKANLHRKLMEAFGRAIPRYKFSVKIDSNH
ncbi:hypothetical protein WD019_10345 [Fictibacillus sp. Mic-4]|uniref:hypothetical protein n=1 Tax=Fictibacillus sp. Mic-4 TaxID=3132826 RepID=UPI003CF2D4CD